MAILRIGVGTMAEQHRVLVTGASRGIGRAVALRMARDGHAVAGCYSTTGDAARQVAEEVSRLGVPGYFAACDVSSADAVERFVEAAEAELGPLDLLVNNAGITRDAPLVLSRAEDWDAVSATNLTQLAELLKAPQIRLSDQDLAALNEASAEDSPAPPA